MSEGPRQCTVFCFALIHHAWITELKTLLLVSSSVRSKELLCFEHYKGQTSASKIITKNFVGLINQSPLLNLHNSITFFPWHDLHYLKLTVARSDFWVTIPFNFERLEHHHYQSNRKSNVLENARLLSGKFPRHAKISRASTSITYCCWSASSGYFSMPR